MVADDQVGIGWKDVAGLGGRSAADPKTAEELNILSTYLKDQYYGNWYHNAGIVSVLPSLPNVDRLSLLSLRLASLPLFVSAGAGSLSFWRFLQLPTRCPFSVPASVRVTTFSASL